MLPEDKLYDLCGFFFIATECTQKKDSALISLAAMRQLLNVYIKQSGTTNGHTNIYK